MAMVESSPTCHGRRAPPAAPLLVPCGGPTHQSLTNALAVVCRTRRDCASRLASPAAAVPSRTNGGPARSPVELLCRPLRRAGRGWYIGCRVPGGRCLLVPAASLLVVLANSFAGLIEHAEVGHRFHVAGSSRLLVPAVSLLVVLANSFAGGIVVTEVEHRCHVACCGRLLIPLKGHFKVLLNTLPLVVEFTETEHGLRITSSGCLLVVLDRLGLCSHEGA